MDIQGTSDLKRGWAFNDDFDNFSDDHSMDSGPSSPFGAASSGGRLSVSNHSAAATAVGGGGGGGGSSSSSSSKLRVQLPASCDPPLPDTPTKPLVWLVFGGTGHMGRSVVKSALAHGDCVALVGRTLETSPAQIQAMAASLAQAAGRTASSCLGALCDVRARASVERVVRRALAHFGGRLDVVANCSGYGVVGACEDQDEHELRNQFETNFMGTVHILQTTLPWLRRQGQHGQHGQHGGRYLIFSSTAGSLGVPGQGPYCATKYAVEGLIEAMQYEVDPYNIKATLVEPGLVRRDDHETGGGRAGRGGDPDPLAGHTTNTTNTNASTSAATPAATTTTTTTTTTASSGYPPAKRRVIAHNRSIANPPLPTWGHWLIQPPSEPYAGSSSPALHTTRIMQWLGDRQPTSVIKSGELVWQLAHCSFPPLRLPLGSYAIESIRDRLRCVTEELEDWKHLNFPLPPDAGGDKTDKADKTDKTEKDKTDKTDKTDNSDKVDAGDREDKRHVRDMADPKPVEPTLV